MERNLDQYIESSFQTAVDKEYIRPYYQPVIRTISRKLCSFEALARWEDPVYGLITPDKFIPVLERSHKIHLLDICIIRQVCARMRKTSDAGLTPVPVSVNLSKLDFTLCDIFTIVDDIVTEYQIPHDFIYIEITESMTAEHEDLMKTIMNKFQQRGYQVWMDDFGSAYSSLNVLKDFSFQELKLDMRFLSAFHQRSRRILTAVIQMAKEIEIHTLAEGVETEEQFRYLRNIGCEKVQGFYFGKPLPYEKAMAHLQDIGISLEMPQDRKYYDDIGNVNLLSAVPFMTREERNALTTARQLNSIPLAIAEARGDHFCILFYNSAFKQTARGTGLISNIFTQEQLLVPQPISILPDRLINLMDSTRSGEMGRLIFISNEEYYEIQAKCIAQNDNAYSVLFRVDNLSQISEALKTSHLDDGLRQLYTLFERITLIDTEKDTISSLYVSTREDLVSGRRNIQKMAEEYARDWIFPADRDRYLKLINISDLEERICHSGRSFVSGYFRTYVGHGQYAWKMYTFLRLRQGNYVELIRNVHSEILTFGEDVIADLPNKASDTLFPEKLVWKNLLGSSIIRFFWKDRDRRFIGASEGFLEYYGFNSMEDIIGKTDEDLGWHIHPDHYKHNEMRVIHEGITTRNIPGYCISKGENHDILASKAPLYNENGEISGLIGYFIDKDLLTLNDSRGAESYRRDILTGLLNSRGITEEIYAFRDEYYLRNIDFARFHVSIEDFSSITRQYGIDFGDKITAALGKALKAAFGLTSSVGRFTGHEFVILHQIHEKDEVEGLAARIKEAASSIGKLDGRPITLYLSVGYCLYSETEDLAEQSKKAGIRLLTDHDAHSSRDSLIARSAELFHMYDDLPISYSVYKVIPGDEGICNAIIFYVNHVFEERGGKKAEEFVGRTTRELFDSLDEGWYQKAMRAAFHGETIIDRLYYKPTGKHYYMTVSPIIQEGFCCFTYQEMDLLNDLSES